MTRRDISSTHNAGATQSSSIKIIGGQWKRTVISVPNVAGLRPTPNRVRETLFNWLGQDLTGLACLDAFAGTGALAFEAASRKATSVLAFESNGSAAQSLLGLQTRLSAKNVQIMKGDGIALMATQKTASFDVVFLDPPFKSDLYLPALKAASRICKSQGFVYLEADRVWLESELEPLGLLLTRQGKAGMVCYHLLQKQ
jgi:16S rRNA (guanine966-N2)-methyltransferase